MKRIRVAVTLRPYDAMVERGILSGAGEVLRALYPAPPTVKSAHGAKANKAGGDRTLFVVTTPTVQKLWGTQLQRSLKRAGFATHVLTMPDGERHKRLSTVEKLADQMVALGADRTAVVVACGGGVVGDCAGFLAAIYMRGVDVVQIPTTLLAQVDASVGGKTGVNLRAGKNLAGAFHQPRVVLIDPDVLRTLPEREYCAGLFEAVKCGIIGKPALFELFETHREAILRRDPALVERIVEESVALKAEVVSQDERESGLRMHLNLGHTIGHALEAEGNFRRYLHGEAVAWGLVAIADIAHQLGKLDAASCERIVNVVLGLGKLPPVNADAKVILRRLQSDKKTSGGQVRFVIPTAIGACEVMRGVPDAVVMKAVRSLHEPKAHSSHVRRMNG